MQTRERRPTREAPSRAVGETRPSVDHRADAPPWYEQTNWWEHPATAYARGVVDGVALGIEQYDAELVAALTEALGEPGDREGAVRSLQRAVDQKSRRDAWYAAVQSGRAA